MTRCRTGSGSAGSGTKSAPVTASSGRRSSSFGAGAAPVHSPTARAGEACRRKDLLRRSASHPGFVVPPSESARRGTTGIPAGAPPAVVPSTPPAYVHEHSGQSPEPDGSVDAAALSLRETTFVVLDLETTGGAPDGGGITEIGAVKVRGGEELGEFGTLVNPGERHPAVHHRADRHHRGDAGAGAADRRRCCRRCWSSCTARCWSPTTRRIDTGFLKAACARHGYPWPQPAGAGHRGAGPPGADRATRCPTTSSARSPATSTPATQPIHRALDDARATVDVLHGLIARLGSHKVHTLGDAIEFVKAVTAGPAAQAPPRRGPARRAGRLHLPRRATAGRSTSARRSDDRDPGPQLLHRRRETRPDIARCSTSPSGSRRSSAPTRWRPRSGSCG